MFQYDDKSWIEHVHVNKFFVAQLTKILKHEIEKDTKFKCAMAMGIMVVFSLYKLTLASKYLLMHPQIPW
jgi:hypothetical protein